MMIKRSSLMGLVFLLLSGCASPAASSKPPATEPPLPTETRTPEPIPTQTDTPEPAQPASPVHLRLNQVGYLPGDIKVALALTDVSLEGSSFDLLDPASGQVVFSGSVGHDRGAYGPFAHLYELDFSELTAEGVFALRVSDQTSPPTTISRTAYGGLIAASLRFFEVQRCGETGPRAHDPCHLLDGIAQGGPLDGETVDAAGGWHDAGDYIKYLITVGYSTNLLLTAYERHPNAFVNPENSSALPAVLAEARVGLDWMLKLWDPEHEVLYYQVSDERDHEHWRLPEQDDSRLPARPLWACEPGKGANVAGKAAAALALASVLWNDAAQPYQDAELAATYLQAAVEIYAYGKEHPEAQASKPTDFYEEKTWRDDLALAAAQLYRATGDEVFLQEARDYAAAAGAFESLDWANTHALAHYEIARLDPTYVDKAAGFLAAHLEAAAAYSTVQSFSVGISEFHWGSNETMANVALEALWYEDLTGDSTYRGLAQDQRDFILGRNPWGVCWVNGAGTNWPRFPHHQIADIAGIELVGFWDEGATPLSTFKEAGPRRLRGEDIYAEFQTEEAVYHDDAEDWVTNEPTITMNAAGLALTAWYASEGR
jgi:hypothetical protein